ncbi:DUF4194 domain-containing protein [Haloferula sp.]|uniref:DUF4194 domain-containing protein n=1 Tax=Haloferula sp. TaxID=2497595 RepID=UPI003C779496
MNPPPTTPESPPDVALSAIIIPLLKGVVYQDGDPKLWAGLLALDARVRDYVEVLDLELVLDESEGYAFLRSRETDPDELSQSPPRTATPRLYMRRQLSFPVSLMLALLRKKLAESDSTGGDTRLVLSRDECAEMLRLFLPTQTNEARITDQIETHLNKIAELGFIRKLKSAAGSGQAVAYEVRRILKAFVDAQWLAEFDARLEAYRCHMESPTEETNEN